MTSRCSVDKALVAFDFDGTLYPLCPYDSEQLLMYLNTKGKGKLQRKRVKRAIVSDQEGKSGLTQFNSNYAHWTKGATKELLEKDIGILLAHVDRNDYSCLEELSLHADLVMLSCGSIDLAKLFVERMGLSSLFHAYYGKTLRFVDGKLDGFTTTLPTTADKATYIRRFQKEYGNVIAVGDGPTDREMLGASDHGVLVRYDGKPVDSPFSIHHDLPSAVRDILNFLEASSSRL